MDVKPTTSMSGWPVPRRTVRRIWCRCPSTGTARRCWWATPTDSPAGTNLAPPGPFGWGWATRRIQAWREVNELPDRELWRPRRRPHLTDGDTMSMATRTDTQSPALHVADSHDLIRMHGARVNNLKHVSVEIPKRRLTVFTGISGSGKSSLVFGTITAESQRLINETYSLPRLRRHPTQRGGSIVEVQRDQHRRCVRDADQRPRRVGAGSGRTVRRAAAGDAAAHPRLVRRDRARLPQPQPPVGTLSGGTWTT